jgi:hypothetical protein
MHLRNGQSKSNNHLITDIPSRLTQYLDKEMNSFEIGELVVTRIDAQTEEETSITPVYDLVISELPSERRNINPSLRDVRNSPLTSTKFDWYF